MLRAAEGVDRRVSSVFQTTFNDLCSILECTAHWLLFWH